MSKVLNFCLGAALSMIGASAFAQPVVLKVNHWSAPDDLLFAKVFTPWAAALNAEAPDVLKIELYHSGALGRNPVQQAQLILDKVIDVGFIVPGLVPGRFSDNQGIELPGQFADVTQATRVREIMLADKKLAGYDDFFVLGITTSPPMNLFTRSKVAKIQDVKGMKIRAANTSDSDYLKALEAVPVFMPVTEIVESISRRTIDGATANPQTAQDFGVNRVTSTYYTAKGVTATLVFLMGRERFNSLPPKAQDAIRKYSGKWLADLYLAAQVPYVTGLDKELRANRNFTVVDPSAEDSQIITAAARSVRDAWSSKSDTNRKFAQDVEAATEKVKQTGAAGTDAAFVK